MELVDPPFDNYRDTHKGKGESYHSSFSANVYRSVVWEIEKAILDGVVLRNFPRLDEVKLLDFACGSGRILGFLERRIATPTGVDVAQSMLDVAAKVAPKSRLLLCDITQDKQLDSERFNLITAFRFFPNAEQGLRDEAMAKLVGLLEPNGLLVFNNHLRAGSLRHWARRLRAKLGVKKSRKELHAMADSEVLALLDRHGLSLVESHHVGVLPILKDKKPLLPQPLLRAVETAASRVGWLSRWSANKIYVARKSLPAEGAPRAAPR